jgi:hypothetical protein
MLGLRFGGGRYCRSSILFFAFSPLLTFFSLFTFWFFLGAAALLPIKSPHLRQFTAAPFAV